MLDAGVSECTLLRQRLRRLGYSPIPVEGKRPASKEWEKKHGATNEEISLWPKSYPYAGNTGALTRLMPTLDIDIADEAAADAIEALAREEFEERGNILVRTGQAPKRAIPLRTDTPFPKQSRNVTAPNGEEYKIELLCDGQQVVVDGIHPKTEKPYAWHGGTPTEIPLGELPYINAEQAAAFLDKAVALLVAEFTYKAASERPPRGNGHGANGDGGAADWGYLFENIRAGRELHESTIVLAAKLIANGMSDKAAEDLIRGEYEKSAAKQQRPEDWKARFDDIARAVATARRKFEHPQADDGAQESKNGFPGGDGSVTTPPLAWVDMSNWDHATVPERKWAILNRVPLNQAGLFSGEGGVGKSIIELQKDSAHTLRRDWLGSLPEPGPAFYIGAEDEEDELHRRLAAIAEHYGVTFQELIDGGLHVLCLLGQDATLCAANGKSGKVETTALYKQLREAAGDIKPKNISVDTLSRAFAGNEIDRSQVYAFAMHMQALAMVAAGSVTILSHPSLQGMASGSGYSGSTAWHGAFRFRQYLTSAKPDGGEQPDDDLRQLEFKKNQYGPKGETITLRYQDGLFLPVPGMAALDKAAAEQRAEQVFLELLRRLRSQGRNVSHKPTANNYAPTDFAKEREAKAAHIKKPDFEAAMRRLFDTNSIHVEVYGRGEWERLVAGAKQEAQP
jgi:RecA-family ATPase